MHVWTTKRGTTRKWPDKRVGKVRAGGFFVKDSLLAACKEGPFTVALQDGYRASTRTILDANASALIVGTVRA